MKIARPAEHVEARNTPDRANRFSIWVTYALVLTAPVYWLPGIPTGMVGLFKDGLLLIFVLSPVLALLNRGMTYPRELAYRSTVLWLVALIAVALPGALLADDLNASLFAYVRFLIVLPLFVQIVRLFRLRPDVVETCFKLMTVPIVLSCVLVALAMIGLIPLNPPSHFIHTHYGPRYMMGLSFRASGLCWSAAYVAPIMAYYSLRDRTIQGRALWMLGLIITTFIAMFLQNRGGLIIMIIAVFGVIIATLATGRSTWKYAVLGVAVTLAALRGPAIMSDLLLRESSAFSSLSEFSLSAEDLNEISSGRWERYLDALDIIAEHPSVGIGFRQEILLADVEWTAHFHNLFLAHTVATGVVSGAVLVGFFIFVGLLAWRTLDIEVRASENRFMIVPIMMLLPHFANTMIESGQMFSNVTQGTPFWFALGALVLARRLNDGDRQGRYWR